MVNCVYSAGLSGVDGQLIKVEVDVSSGLPVFEMVGNLSGEIKEAKDRIRVALKNVGISLPAMRVTINLSPADVRKEGTYYDLPITFALLASMEIIDAKKLEGTMVVGELGLSGEIKMVKGILPMVIEARDRGFKRCIVPRDNAMESAVVSGIEIIGLSHLEEAISYLLDESTAGGDIKPVKLDVKQYCNRTRWDFDIDYEDLYGQEHVKRAMEIAAAGFHNVLMIGAPGAGKTMAAKRLPTIMPPLSLEESIEVSKIYSVSGLLNENEVLISKRPFMAPHHTVSASGLAGGGKSPKPGMISKAHKGVLFLDEMVHFSAQCLEILRQPIEDKQIHVVRTNWNYIFPADFMLVGAMNPCPCGYYPDYSKCTCTPEMIRRYIGKISGPILDRFDVCVDMPRMSLDDISKKEKGESSLSMRERVLRAVEIQKERYKEINILFNSELSASDVDKYIVLGAKEKELLEKIYDKYGLSVRGYHRLLRVARTIADLEASEQVLTKHILEAVGYRGVEDKYFNL